MSDDTKDLSLGDNVDGTDHFAGFWQIVRAVSVFITRSMQVEGDEKHVRRSRFGK